jgi:hypothetical protein
VILGVRVHVRVELANPREVGGRVRYGRIARDSGNRAKLFVRE